MIIHTVYVRKKNNNSTNKTSNSVRLALISNNRMLSAVNWWMAATMQPYFWECNYMYPNGQRTFGNTQEKIICILTCRTKQTIRAKSFYPNLLFILPSPISSHSQIMCQRIHVLVLQQVKLRHCSHNPLKMQVLKERKVFSLWSLPGKKWYHKTFCFNKDFLKLSLRICTWITTNTEV